ncbi:MAG: 1-phosphofructokinase [Candidatus Omnitrophota bacterium]|nr:1-phosphofructokinase [Candidatus Omnitrophota bacterium]
MTPSTLIATVTLNPSLDEWVELPALRPGRLHRATSFSRYAGGKGINVSRVVHELGANTRAFALAGGEDGAILRTLLQRLAIPQAFVTLAGSTRNNYKIQTRAPRLLTEINTPGPRVPKTALRALERRLFRQRPAPRCVVLSGSLPPGVSHDLYRRWIQRLHRLGIPAVLDSSGVALRQGLRARPWVIKPNRHEAEELLQRRLNRLADVADAASALAAQGPDLVIVSLGADGAVLASRPDQPAPASGRVWFARPPTVKVDSAVGAGDSLIGGFLVGWARRLSLLEAFRLGVACGAATAMTPGTELCHRADVKRLLGRVTIRRLA